MLHLSILRVLSSLFQFSVLVGATFVSNKILIRAKSSITPLFRVRKVQTSSSDKANLFDDSGHFLPYFPVRTGETLDFIIFILKWLLMLFLNLKRGYLLSINDLLNCKYLMIGIYADDTVVYFYFDKRSGRIKMVAELQYDLRRIVKWNNK